MRVRDSNGTKIRKSFSEQKLPLPKITKLGGSRAKVAPLAQVKRIGGAVEFHAWEGASVVKTTVPRCTKGYQPLRCVLQNFSLRDTWVLSPTLVVRTGETNPSEAEDGKLFPIVDLGLYMRRRPRYYCADTELEKHLLQLNKRDTDRVSQVLHVECSISHIPLRGHFFQFGAC